MLFLPFDSCWPGIISSVLDFAQLYFRFGLLEEVDVQVAACRLGLGGLLYIGDAWSVAISEEPFPTFRVRSGTEL